MFIMCSQLVYKKCLEHINQKNARELEPMDFFQDRSHLLVGVPLETEEGRVAVASPPE